MLCKLGLFARRLSVLLCTGLVLLPAGVHAESVCIREDFTSLEAWTHKNFEKIEQSSTYTTGHREGRSVLQAVTRNSASFVVHNQVFDVFQCPVITWRWKVQNIYTKGDAATKEGDDYPLRVYILFEYDPEEAGFAKRIKYGLIKNIYGQYPPDSSVNYIWANRQRSQDPIPNPYTDRAMMIPVRSGTKGLGTWMSHTRHIVEDYEQAFGHPPPARAKLAVMSDSDNTGEQAEAFVDFILVQEEDHGGAKE
mgnify:CR=1 FL=1